MPAAASMARGTLLGWVLGLAHVAGGRFEGRRREPDQIEAGHHRGQVAEPTLEGRRQVIGEGLVPVDCAGEHRHEGGKESERGRAGGNGNSETRNPFNAAKIHEREEQHDGDGDSFHGQRGEVPVLQRASGKERGQTAGRDPTPPVASACQRGEDGVVRPEGFRAGGRDAADAIGPHQHQLGPRWRRGPAEQHADDEQRHRRAALSENVSLADEQRRDDENHLVAAAHGQGGGANPAKHAWVRRRRNYGLCYGTH